MSYPRFFIESARKDGEYVSFDKSSSDHISRSLRMRPGEKVIACDENGIEYECELSYFSSDEVRGKVLSERKSEHELPIKVELYQCCPKGDKNEFIIQKCVELGMTSYIPVMSERCVVKYTSSDKEKKQARWQKIALEAAKQSGRGKIPFVGCVTDFEQAAEKASKADLCFVCYENEDGLTLKGLFEERKELFDIKSGMEEKRIAFIVGSEGGLSEKEIEICKKYGIPSVGLGKRIMRTETAGIFVLSCIGYLTGL